MILYIASGALACVMLAAALPRIALSTVPPELDRRHVCAAAGAASVWLAVAWGSVPSAWPHAQLWWTGVVATLAALYDYRARVIPNRLLIVASAGVLATAFVVAPARIWGMVLSCIALLAVMVGMAAMGRGGLGAGDVKLVAFLGLALGLRAGIVAAAAGFVAMGLPSIYHVLFGKGRKHKLPYAPFLWLGTLVWLLLGNTMLV
jgi:Flp pilus assembly protein protease CpaA